ncbi:neuropeptide-like protein 29 [Aricia agestis]|uniref:neuropeptide-like protein 29 n=1 Tax=Aricia agestis TaxID=91739 RepID=UPI001C202C36|nr:neuropeptide-like protein 29 [Aricia agestis]
MKVIYVLLLVCVAYAAALPALAPHDGALEAKPETLESLELAENRHWGGGYGNGGWGHGGYGGWGHGGYGGGWGRGGGWGHGGGWGRGGGWRG